LSIVAFRGGKTEFSHELNEASEACLGPYLKIQLESIEAGLCLNCVGVGVALVSPDRAH